MSVSSGTTSLFSAVAFFIAAAGGAAYGLKHKDDVKRFISEVTGIETTKLVTDNQSDAAAVNVVEDDNGAPGDVTLRAGPGGHFEASAEINGRSVDVLVDTGATLVVLTYEDAERAGIFLRPADFTARSNTANGVAKFAPVDIESIAIDNITVRNVRGAVSERGKLHKTLLGMSFLGKISRVEMRKNALVLHE